MQRIFFLRFSLGLRKQNPRYRWGDVKIIFGDRRLQLLKGRAKRQHEQARELQRKFTA